MARYIDKDALVQYLTGMAGCVCCDENVERIIRKFIIPHINTLEVKEVNAWHLQEKEDIYDAVKDWSLQTFVCVMKDWSIQRFTGNLDEDYEGHINVHINGINDDYDDVDDIVKWIELT